jgi:glutamyl-tRNA synthetase
MENLDEGEAVLRVKTDIEHKNPAIRDYAIMRIVDAEHPRIGMKYKIYPMMNFSVAVDDHLCGITHVLRGKDHLANSEKQKYLYNYFGWNIPVFIHYGRLRMEDVALSTSKARAGIDEGIYSGWDDPRLGTIRAIAKRGIMKEAIQELMNEIGVKMADSIVSWKKIYGLNRSILEEAANRYFFVWNPEEVIIDDLPQDKNEIIKRPLHPDFLDRGYREIPFNGEFYVVTEDLYEGYKEIPVVDDHILEDTEIDSDIIELAKELEYELADKLFYKAVRLMDALNIIIFRLIFLNYRYYPTYQALVLRLSTDRLTLLLPYFLCCYHCTNKLKSCCCPHSAGFLMTKIFSPVCYKHSPMHKHLILLFVQPL